MGVYFSGRIGALQAQSSSSILGTSINQSMLLHQITVNFLLFTVGLLGILLNYGRILITFLALELMLLSASLNFISFSVYLNDFYGQIFSIFILTVAASESAVGLALLIIYYKIKGDIDISLIERKR